MSLLELLRRRERFGIGVLSGTSVDGIDVGYVHLQQRKAGLHVELLGFETYPIAPALRQHLLQNLQPELARLPQLSQLNFLVGELFAEAILQFRAAFKVKQLDFVASHGQTFWHQPEPQRIGKYAIRSTLQLGEGAVIANRVGVPVISDFRVSEVAMGGEGAPLAPYLDWLLYGQAPIGRVLLNIGGIANLTALKPFAEKDELIFFDCGPGNVFLDAATQALFKKPFDKDGAFAAKGNVSRTVLSELLRDRYYQKAPPKSTGREYFSHAYLERILARCKQESLSRYDILATLTALTAESIAMQVRKFVLPKFAVDELWVSGGGAENPTLMRFLKDALPEIASLKKGDVHSAIPAKAKEAVLFAVLGDAFLSGQSASLTTPAILGKLSLPAGYRLA